MTKPERCKNCDQQIYFYTYTDGSQAWLHDGGQRVCASSRTNAEPKVDGPPKGDGRLAESRCATCGNPVALSKLTREWYHPHHKNRKCFPGRGSEYRMVEGVYKEVPEPMAIPEMQPLCILCKEEVYLANPEKETYYHVKPSTCSGTGAVQAEPAVGVPVLNLPQPDPDGDAAEDDLIGVVGMLSEVLQAVQEHFQQHSSLHEKDWRAIWRAHGEPNGS